tara:strand:+ start:5004 stop:5489 length:486 start_codon:yes stop_codon:yes gene_type:complete
MYQLTEDLKHLKALMEQEGEELDESLDLYLSKLQSDLEWTVEGAIKLSRELDAMAEARVKEGQRLVESGKSLAHQSSRLRNRLKERLEECDERKVTTPLFTVTVSKSGGKQKIDVREEDVPMEWKKATFKPDMDLIRNELEKGSPLGFAQLIPRGTHLRVK